MKFVSFRYRLSSNRNFLFTAAAMTKKDRRDKVIAQEEQKWLFEAYKTSLRCEIQAKSNERNLIVRAMSMWRLKTNELRSTLDRNLRRQMKSWHFFCITTKKIVVSCCIPIAISACFNSLKSWRHLSIRLYAFPHDLEMEEWNSKAKGDQ